METNGAEHDKAAAYLVYEYERRAYPLSDASFVIGRDGSSQIVVREPAVSRFHAEVRAEAGEYVLHASGATGTRLNGHAVTTPKQLKDGDHIEIGTAGLTFKRSKLPLGVSIVDHVDRHPLDDILSKRTTITNPILGSGHHPAERRGRPAMVIFLLVLAAIATYLYFTQLR